MRAIHHARTISCVGLGIALAAACGGNNEDNGQSNSSATTSPGTVLVDGNTSSATTSPSTSSGGASNQTSTSTSGATGGGSGTGGEGGEGATGGSGSGGSSTASSGGTGTGGTGAEGGAGGESGAAGAGGDWGVCGLGPVESGGFDFEDDSTTWWRIKPGTDCGSNCFDAGVTLGASGGALTIEADWPAAADTASQKTVAEGSAESSWDLRGARITVRARWVSGGATDNNGFNVYVELNDDSGYSYYAGAGQIGEWYASNAGGDFDDFEFEVPCEAVGDFDPAHVKLVNVRFDSKFWTDESNPPTFNYDTTVFEIDSVTWE